MKILVLNCGSSSVKCQLIETSPELIEANRDRQLARVSVENTESAGATIHCQASGKPRKTLQKKISGHQEAVETAVETLMEQLGDVVPHKNEIEGVGHRIVHGGERFTKSSLMTDAVVQEIKDVSELAPLHNPENLKGYDAARKILPHAKHVAVFDTSFHQTLPRHAFMYGLPYDAYERYRIRRYGFHGTSHRYVSRRFAQVRNSKFEDWKLITCHLGNGCSMTAIDRGKSVDTSMGFTPLEGLLMGTRSGDVDPAAVLYLMEKQNVAIEEASRVLNHESGLYGLSGIANDMRELLEQASHGHERARLAVDVFCYRVKKYIGAYLGVLNGCDAVIFTGGIGENGPAVRAQICEGLDALGIRIDPQRNNATIGAEKNISPEGAATQVWVIPTDEELLIARDTVRCILAAE